MSTYDLFYEKLGGYAIDGPALHEPYRYIGTVYLEHVYPESSKHCVWTGRAVADADCVRILGITGNESSSVCLSAAGVSGIQQFVAEDGEITVPSDGVYTRYVSGTASDRTPRTFCPICTEGIDNEEAVGLNENAVTPRDDLRRQSTVYIHKFCMGSFSDVVDGFWSHADEMLGDAL